ncbi:primosome protein [Mycoplasmopsis arginini]|uniref:primosome protein n=1 Tax=Mycoplasmopsis arginini TaxID=2094 RepID=UPI000D611BBF|nr:primosome protein [Mycoplasmopsis arginini]PWC08953.1 primosome protein [Mycoplasmopsis arginini]
MKKQFLNDLISLKKEIDVENLRKEVLSKDFIQEEIKRLNLNDFQINKGMGVLQRYHDFYIQNHKKPEYKLFVDIYGFLAEDFSNDTNFLKHQQLENFWLTSITNLDPIIQKYFEPGQKDNLMSSWKKTAKNYINSLPKTQESRDIENIFKKMLSKDEFDFNILFLDPNIVVGNEILKYIASMNAIINNKTVAFLNTNDLFNYISSHQEEKQSISYYINNVDILILTNLTLGVKPQWFLDFLINIFESRRTHHKPILISSSRDILNKSVKLLSNYYYSKTEENELEKVFKSTVKNYFKFIKISKD